MVEQLQVCTLDSTDAWYTDMVQNIKDVPAQFPKFKLVDNKLLKLCNVKDDLKQASVEWRIVVPQNLVEDVLKEHHDLPVSGHLGVPKTSFKL